MSIKLIAIEPRDIVAVVEIPYDTLKNITIPLSKGFKMLKQTGFGEGEKEIMETTEQFLDDLIHLKETIDESRS
jgi:hypothetical protein